MKNKVPLVFWSGRLEATAYVLQCIKAGVEIDTISMVHPEKALVAVGESSAREKILAYINDHYANTIRNQYVCYEDDILDSNYGIDEKPHSCIYWAYYLLLNFNPDIHSHVVCCIAKDGTSPYWQFHRDLMVLFEHLRKKYHRDDITLQYPYKHISVKDIADTLDEPVLDMVCKLEH